MRDNRIKIVIKEMKELRRRIDLLYKEGKCNKEYDYYGENPSKESSAIKRKSMDLSRALTEMRKP